VRSKQQLVPLNIAQLQQDYRDLRTVVVISDIHDGNINAVCTPLARKYIRHHRKRLLQEKLYDAWVWCSQQLTKPEIDLLIINGDAIDGDNRKDLGAETWTTSMTAQVNDCEKLITDHYKFKNVIVTNGSGYHVKRGADQFEEILAERLARHEIDGKLGNYLRSEALPREFKEVEGVTRVQGVNYSYTDYKWRFKCDLVGRTEVFSITHHVGHSQVEFYRSTPLAREMVTSELDASKYSPDERPTILLRAHAHYYCLLDFSSSTGIITPAWKFPDEYLHRRGIGGTLPSIGIEEILLRPNKETQFHKILAKGIRYPKEKIPNITPFLWKRK
jgi:hypothetical protein